MVGPRQEREPKSEAGKFQVLLLRLEAEAVAKMDEAWRAKGIKNRMEFLRGAIGHYLTHLGAEDAAGMFATE